MFSNDKQENVAFFNDLCLAWLYTLSCRPNCPTFSLHFFIIIIYFKVWIEKKENIKVPLVLCDVTGAHAVLLLKAAIQLNVLLPVAWDW